MEIPGFVEPGELQWLHDQAARFQTVLEVGTWKGRSASALAAGCPGKVYTVDHFAGSPSELDGAHAEALTIDLFAEADRNLAAYSNVEFLRWPSMTASRMFAVESIDMVFLDGDHTREAVVIDLLSWRPKTKHLLCGHDRDWDGVYGALVAYGVPYENGPGSIWYMEIRHGC